MPLESCGIQEHFPGNCRESIPPVGGAVGIQTSGPAVTPQWPMSRAQLLSDSVQGSLENTILENHPLKTEPLWKSRSQCRGEKNKSLDAWERVKERVQVYPMSPLPRQHSSLPRHIFLKPRLLLAPSCPRVLVSSDPCRVLSPELNDCGLGRGWKRGT